MRTVAFCPDRLRALAAGRHFGLAAFDLDGTLLDTHHRLTPATVRAVRRVEASGVRVLLATARTVGAIRPYLELLATPGLVVAHNGALVCDTATGAIPFRCAVDRQVALAAVQTALAGGLAVHFNGDERVYAFAPHPLSRSYGQELGITLDYPEAGCAPPEDPVSVLVIGEFAPLDALRTQLACAFAERFAAVLAPWKERIWRLQLRAPATSKGAAVFAVARTLGIIPTEVLAFGDNLNDSELIAGCGLGIAMGNAVLELQELADFVTLDNAREGVARALEVLFPKH
ncbi:HAD-IIB family hydrolase [Gloeobacter morelensis]|uniref:HAD-IIB family hydrolase n=1 Tax=Gloeobacter morelensis MG652769 TaxID=2781736 RepID=A0ABY3PS33_9CYAN|nr:HAD-IIB family hydrolase [Gloeobacter morelensis]UFP96329.1 HAD-IIB family hydrolase [Gloeobacter morelensis MG652769]